MSPLTVAASSTDTETLSALDQFARTLPDGPTRDAIETVAGTLRDGRDVIIAGADDGITPNQAATILGVSRAHLYKVLDSGALPFTVVGTRDRRIAMSDICSYVLKTERLRREVALRAAHPRSARAAAIDEM